MELAPKDSNLHYRIQSPGSCRWTRGQARSGPVIYGRRAGFPPATILLLLALWLPAQAQEPRVTEDPASHDLVVLLGPMRLGAHAEHHDVTQLGLQTITMPYAGWIQGYRVELRDGAGNLLPQELLHHAEFADLERRALLRNMYQRIASAGRETPELLLPPTLGYPVRQGHRLGVIPMVTNPTDQDYPEVYLRVVLRVAREGSGQPPRAVYTFHAEVPGTIPNETSFDLAPGRSVQSHDFSVPIGGTLLALGGHLHDYGTRMTLVNLTTGDTLYDAVPQRDAEGRVLGMPAKPLWGRGVRVDPAHRYRLSAVYDNPTGRTLHGGGMVTLGCVFMPDRAQDWPRLDANDPEIRADLASLQVRHFGMGAGAMSGMRRDDD